MLARSRQSGGITRFEHAFGRAHALGRIGREKRQSAEGCLHHPRRRLLRRTGRSIGGHIGRLASSRIEALPRAIAIEEALRRGADEQPTIAQCLQHIRCLRSTGGCDSAMAASVSPKLSARNRVTISSGRGEHPAPQRAKPRGQEAWRARRRAAGQGCAWGIPVLFDKKGGDSGKRRPVPRGRPVRADRRGETASAALLQLGVVVAALERDPIGLEILGAFEVIGPGVAGTRSFVCHTTSNWPSARTSPMSTGLVMWWLASILETPPVRFGASMPGSASMTCPHRTVPTSQPPSPTC